MSVSSKKRRADRRCCFIDDEALETKEDSQEESEEEEEDNQESYVVEQDGVMDDIEDLDLNNNNHDFTFNVDVSNHQQFPPLFESSSDDESVNDKTCDDESKTHDQEQLFPSRYESSDDDDDKSLNTITASSASRQETLVTESKNMFDCPIITSFPRPSYAKDRIQEFKYNHGSAPCHRDAVITYETMGDDEILLRKEPLESKGIKEVHSFVKQGRGLLWHNRTSAKLHYETSMSTYQDFVIRKASKGGIRSRLFDSDSSSLQRMVEGPNIFLFKSGTFEHFHEKVWFQELIRDACIHAPHTVPRMDSVRENSGPSVGLCTSQGLTLGTNESFAIPGWLAGTHRYMKVFDIISKTTKSFLDSANLSDRLPLTNSSALPKQKFLQSVLSQLMQRQPLHEPFLQDICSSTKE